MPKKPYAEKRSILLWAAECKNSQNIQSQSSIMARISKIAIKMGQINQKESPKDTPKIGQNNQYKGFIMARIAKIARKRVKLAKNGQNS